MREDIKIFIQNEKTQKKKKMNFLFLLILIISAFNLFKCLPNNVYEKGNMNLIVTMPHGGMSKPVDILNRTGNGD